MKRNEILIVVLVVVVSFIGILLYSEYKDNPVETSELPDRSGNLVLDLNFDDPLNPWKDYGPYNIQFTPKNNPKWADKSVCKWYGCMDATDDTAYETQAMYLEGHNTFDFSKGFATSFWVFLTKRPGSGASDTTAIQGYFDLGFASYNGVPGTTYIMESGWGAGISYHLQNDTRVGASTSQNYPTAAGEWTHYFIDFNPVEKRIRIWKNNVLRRDSVSENFQAMAPKDLIRIATHRYGDMVGYLDELKIWNTGGFTNEEVAYFYNSVRMGTPPEKDIFVKDIKYEIPYAWGQLGNPIITGGTMPITITITNQGTQPSGEFSWAVVLEGEAICSGKLSLSEFGEQQVVCDWKTEVGFKKGYVFVDSGSNIEEENEINNKQTLYIPFMSRPWYHFSYDEWVNDLKPYCQSPLNTNTPAGQICTRWLSHFAAESWSSSWTCNSVDPYGTKVFQMALGCAYNNYDMSRPMCINAMNFLKGWANLDPAGCTNVQGTHYFAYVGHAFDIMAPVMTKEQYDSLAAKFQEKCQVVTRLATPHKDNKDNIHGGNGFGFGSGNGGFCYSLIGADKENPTLILKTDQNYWGQNIPTEWMDREISYLRSYKNDPYSQYQEGLGYKWYAETHLLSNWWFEKRYGLVDNSMYGNAFCAMARETMSIFLDFNYNGKTLRNDKDSPMRFIQRGDSPSYDPIGSGYIESLDVILFEGLLCDDPDIKSAALWLRDEMQNKQAASWTYPSAYLYKLLKNQVVAKPPQEVLERFMYDNANDIFLLRDGYTYKSDSVLYVDGGEEKGGGHSQAQGYYLYALGEPFIDYEQVPYNDDVRDERYKNGISFISHNDPKNGWNSACGELTWNQYYGMLSCPVPTFSKDYPDNRNFPIELGGDLEDYMGTKDGMIGGVYVWRPYSGATEPVKEYFVKYGDIVAKRTVVTGSPSGVYHNFISLTNEFIETRDENSFTLTRTGTNKKMKTQLVYASQPMTVSGGDTGIRVSFCKTSICGNGGTYRRMIFGTEAPSVDMIHTHTWSESEIAPVIKVGNQDIGVQQNQNIIVFDSNNDGVITYGDVKSDGWAILLNLDAMEFGAFGSTYYEIGGQRIFESDIPVSYYIKPANQTTLLEINTMSRAKYIDSPSEAKVSVYGKTFEVTPPQVGGVYDIEVAGELDDDDDIIEEKTMKWIIPAVLVIVIIAAVVVLIIRRR